MTAREKYEQNLKDYIKDGDLISGKACIKMMMLSYDAGYAVGMSEGTNKILEIMKNKMPKSV